MGIVGGRAHPFAGTSPNQSAEEVAGSAPATDDDEGYETNGVAGYQKMVLPIDVKRVHDHYMLYLRFGKHCVLRGILLSLEGHSIRVALEDCGDAAEYRRVENGWVDEFGQSLEIEFQPMASAGALPFPLTAAFERLPAQHCVS